MLITPVTHILPLAKVRRRRYLPVAGTVLVRAGQEVKATDVIAEAIVNPEHVALNIERALGVPLKQVMEYVQRAVGDVVPQGGIIASRKGLFSRVVRAPRAGTLVAIGGGQALLQVSSKPFQLVAGIPGTVTNIEADYGAVIETSGVWVQGIWGNGKTAVGELKNLAESPNHTLKPTHIDPDMRGTIALAGHCSDPAALEKVRGAQLRGLILGSMSTRLIPVASRMDFPIMVLEGFGSTPINSAAFSLLGTNEQREATLNAMKHDPDSGDRPEIVIPLSGAGDPPIPPNLAELTIGKQVRILRAPHVSRVGAVNMLLSEPYRFPNGLRHQAVEVVFEQEEKVIVPVANIEVIG